MEKCCANCKLWDQKDSTRGWCKFKFPKLPEWAIIDGTALCFATEGTDCKVFKPKEIPNDRTQISNGNV